MDYHAWRIMKYSAKPRDVLDVKTATDAENREFCELHPQKPGKATVTVEDKFNRENKITTEIEVKGFYIAPRLRQSLSIAASPVPRIMA